MKFVNIWNMILVVWPFLPEWSDTLNEFALLSHRQGQDRQRQIKKNTVTNSKTYTIYSPKIVLEGFKFGNDSVWGGAIKTPENKWFGVTNIYFCIFLWHGLFKWFISKVQHFQKPNSITVKFGKATCFAEEPSVCSYSKDVPLIVLDKTPRRAPAIFL